MSSSMAARQGGEKVSSFAVTCNLLSQYIKEKGRSLGDLGLGMAPIGKNETCRPPTTMSLLPATKSMDLFPQRAGFGLHTPPAATAAKNKESELKKNQLTIFYCGKVLVFDNFPAEKAKDLMMLAGKGCGVAENYNSSPSTVASAAPAEAKNKSSSKSVSVAINNTPAAATVTATQRPVQTVVSDLPIARKASLHRFLEKRKDRINAKAPYQLNQAKDFPVSVATPKIEESQPWLGLKPSPNSECSR